MQYIITNGFGDQLGGISTNEGEIKRMAQRAANDLGKSVWYTALAEDFEAVEVEPEADEA